MQTWLAASIAFFALIGSSLAQQLDPVPDRQVDVVWGVDGSYSGVLYWPENFDAEKVHPVFFWYHGTGGQPNTTLIQRYSDKQDWIIVGMPYAGEGGNALSGPALEIEVRRIAAIRAKLSEFVQIRDQWWVGGFSKGGWIASLFAQMDVPDLAGSAILGAGIMPGGIANDRGFKARSGTNKVSVLLGIGQLDTNYVYSLRALDKFKNKGWNVVLDDFPSYAHTMPMNPQSQGFRQWLKIQAAAKLTPELAEESRAWWDDRMTRSATLENPEERLLYLEKTLQLPLASLIPTEERTALANKVAAVAKHPAMAATQRARASLNLAVEAEKRFNRSPELPAIARRYITVYEENSESWFGQRALLDAKRALDNQKMLSGNQDDIGLPVDERMDKAMKMAKDLYVLIQGE